MPSSFHIDAKILVRMFATFCSYLALVCIIKAENFERKGIHNTIIAKLWFRCLIVILVLPCFVVPCLLVPHATYDCILFDF